MARITAFFVLSVLLCACASAGIGRATFLSDFRPTTERVNQYDSITRLAYMPRVTAHGLKAVNNAVNSMPFLPDACEQHPIEPAKFWKHGGDCEEYALIKMLELRAQGMRDTYFLVVADKRGGKNHAVLVAEETGRLVVLDNRSKDIVPLEQFYIRYKPIYMIDGATGQVMLPKP